MKKRVIYPVVLILSIFYGGAILRALPPENLIVEIRTSQQSPSIGDSLSIFCTVIVPQGVRVSEPHLPGRSLFIDIEKIWQKEEALDAGDTRKHFGFRTYVISPDTLTLGPFTVQYTTAEGDTGKVSSNEIKLLVKSVINNPEEPPYSLPNRSPMDITARNLPAWLKILLIVLALLVIALVVYIALKRRKSIPASSLPMKPIDEIHVFERIRAMKLHEKGQIRDLYIQVSNAMRSFIHRNMQFDALFETSEEIVMNLSRNSVERSILDPISEVFEESDMVKFAKYIPTVEQSSTIIDRALKPVKSVLKEIEREKERLAAESEASSSPENKGDVLVGTAVEKSKGKS
ncbi:MAG: hypothetical protein HOC71_12240 [Candidatus Latescibacteria bacterium]|jgi:hypothetical protein|nr:hypothetical protein [Candidatus Latescibacterota bacterium]